MSKLKKNIIVNFIGKGWASLIILIFAPLYIKFLGMEAYGIIGFFLTLKALLILFDFGISTTINRQLAQYSVDPNKAEEAKDMVRSLEIIYWIIGLALGALIWSLSPFIAYHWIKSNGLSKEIILESVKIMGFIFAVQWPFNFYKGGLLGLQRQVLLNGITITMNTLSAAGGILVVWLISPTIIAFFKWQVFVSLLQVFISQYFLWNALPKTTAKPGFQFDLIKKIWKFAAGLSVTALLILILKQSDKIILSNILSLEFYGYYMLSVTVGTFLNVLSIPTNYALFPRFSELAASRNESELTKLYHRASQFMSILIFPAAFVVMIFSYEILFIWLQSETTAQIASPIVSVFLLGTAFNNITGIAYDFQVAHGWTKLGVYKNLVAILILVPAIIWAANHYGAIGAAWMWVILNLGYFLIEIPIMHTRLLKGEMVRWYSIDVLVPLVTSLIIPFCLYKIISFGSNSVINATFILLTYILTVAAAVFSTPYGRASVAQIIKNKLK